MSEEHYTTDGKIIHSGGGTITRYEHMIVAYNDSSGAHEVIAFNDERMAVNADDLERMLASGAMSAAEWVKVFTAIAEHYNAHIARLKESEMR